MLKQNNISGKRRKSLTENPVLFKFYTNRYAAYRKGWTGSLIKTFSNVYEDETQSNFSFSR